MSYLMIVSSCACVGCYPYEQDHLTFLDVRYGPLLKESEEAGRYLASSLF